MIKTRIKTITISFIAALSLLVPAVVPAVASADSIQNCVSQGTQLGQTPLGTGSGTCTGNIQGDAQTANSQFNSIITTVVNIFSIVVGIIAVIMIIVGGMKYITSGGETGKVSSAKNTILFALVGLIIVALAQFIVHFVLGKVASVGGSSVLTALSTVF